MSAAVGSAGSPGSEEATGAERWPEAFLNCDNSPEVAGAARTATEEHPLTAIRETCTCGAKIHVKHPDPAPIAADWRNSHPCDRRAGSEREVVAGAIAEIAQTEPHPTDGQVGQRLGFVLYPPMGRVISSAGEDA